MRVFKRPGTKFYQYEFGWRGKFHRGSTKQTTRATAQKFVCLLMAKAEKEGAMAFLEPPTLKEYALEFLDRNEQNQTIKDSTRKYYKFGWKLLGNTSLTKMRIDEIRDQHVSSISFPGGGSTANTAIKTLRRILNDAFEADRLIRVPKIKLREERRRELLLDDAAEAKIFPHLPGDIRAVVTIVRDTNARPGEARAFRWEFVQWDKAMYMTKQKSKVVRPLYLSNRVMQILHKRHIEAGLPSQGWVFPARNIRSKSGHIESSGANRHFRVACERAGLPKDLVVYSGRHDWGTRASSAITNIKVVSQMMGHQDIATTMRYNHPTEEVAPMLEVVNRRVM